MPTRIDTALALQMHAQGKSDGDIARHFGVTQSGATRWRQRQGLPPNVTVYVRPHLSVECRRRGRKMLREGATAEQVARAIGCSKNTAKSLRKGLKGDLRLRGHGMTLQSARSSTRRDAGAILAELKAATRHVPDAFLRDDVMGDMFLDMMEGRLARDRIKVEARRYSGRAIDMWQSKWAPVSIDEDLTGDGFRLVDLIECPSAAAWVESVGA